LARWGGEEFVILVHETGRDFSHVLAEKLCQSIARHNFFSKGKITCIFGVTEYIAGESSSDFINRADQAL
jgi:two-component system cell cycle response regulator